MAIGCGAAIASSADPALGQNRVFPGVVQAEDFDQGPAGVAYSDSTAGNTGKAYRATDVDIESTTDSGGGYNLAWLTAGEWLKYTVNVAVAGTYDLEVRVASRGAGGIFHIEIDGADRTGPITIPETGGWQQWVSLHKTDLRLAAGRQVWRVVMDRNGEFAVGNINFFRVASPTKDALLTAVAAVPVPSTATPTSPTASNPPQSDIVLYASDVTKAVGNWVRGSFSTGAGGEAMQSKDAGRSNTKEPLAAPSDYFEAQFTPQANKPYRVWMRLRAIADSKFNDSVWLQFSGALDAHGAPLWRIGTTSGLLMNLESCTNCGVSGWGWQTGAWWVSQDSVVRFPAPTEQTLRVQIREDGVQIDQIVISADKYFDAPPGAPINDTNIVSNGPATAAAADPKPNPPTSSLGDASGDATSHNPANQPQDRRHVLGFAPAADHDANVTSYSVALYRADAPPTDQPVASASLGKPDVTNGQISVDISAIVNSLPPGWYYVVVSAHSLAGTAIGPPSTPFPR